MSFQLQIAAANLPPATCYPSTFQQALNLIAQNLFVTGLGALNSFSYGPTTPATDLQDRPWIRTDSQFKFLGIYTFTQGSWQPADPPFKPGDILDFYGDPSMITAPWYQCNGQAIVGPINGALTTPNLQGLVTIGQGTNPATGINYPYASTGGGSAVLTALNVPAHPHTLSMQRLGASGGGSFGFVFSGPLVAAPDLIGGGNSTGIAADGVTPNPPTAIPTIPPYLAVYKKIFWP